MMKKYIYIVLGVILVLSLATTVYLFKNSIAANLAFGITTALHLPDTIKDVKVLNNKAYKFKWAEDRIFITPKFKKGRTILSCWTEDKKRYDFYLIIGQADKADYLIKVENIVTEKEKKGG